MQEKLTLENWIFNESAYFKLYGRIKYCRSIGKISFLKINYLNQIIQLVLDKKITCPYPFKCKIGDIVLAEGKMGYSHSKEQSLLVERIKLIAVNSYYPSDKYNSIKDPKLLNVFRCVKLDTDPNFYNTLILRSKLFKKIREYFNSKNFLETDVNILRPYYGGAEAQPFVTKFNESKHNLFLSISPQFELKQLIIGGYPKVFTITHNFRNEGVDRTHHPEFSAVEAYELFETYEGMNLHIKNIITSFIEENRDVLAPDVINLFSKWEEKTYNELTTEIRKIPAQTLISMYPQYFDAEVYKLTEEQVIFRIFDKVITPTLYYPTFVTEFPSFVTSLAKSASTEGRIQKSELYVKGIELSNVYTEQTDPTVLQQCFKSGAGKDLNNTFIEKVKYGLPPCGGMGLGICRLVCLLTNVEKIHDALPFLIYG